MSTEARADPQPSLDAYAAIGDGRTVALVALDGTVDWLPMPNLDSAPPFARLLDTVGGGYLELQPSVPFESTRRYLPDTNVLETVHHTRTGSVRVTDALVTGVAGRLPWTELARRIEGLEGTVPMRWSMRPGTMLSTASPWLQDTVHGPVHRVDGLTLGVTGLDHGPAEPDMDGHRGAFTTTPGSRHLLVLAAAQDEPLHVPEPRNVDRGIDRTIDNWRAWSHEFSYDGPWADAVQRSALALKLLIYSPTGAISAAATTSLPESPAGGKNWDYRFAWVRDLSYTVHTLVRFGLREETQAALSWMLRTIATCGADLHVFYTLRGETPGPPVQHDVPGYRGSQPVVTGNPASGQLQLGVFGDLFTLMRLYVDAGNVLDVTTGRLLADIADRTADHWHMPDSGMWELEDVRHYTSSKMGCWMALDAAAALARMNQIPGSADRWENERDRIAAWIHEHGWDESRGAFVMSPGDDRLDTSVLLHAPSGFDRGERMARTIEAINAELGVDVRLRDGGTARHLYRYSGMREEEQPFVACAFWNAAALACVGRHEQAVAAMDALIGSSNDVGLFAEMVDEDGQAWGNLPQGLSHLALITAAITIDELDPESHAQPGMR